jgi:type VI protein secretion system component Hcp
LEVNMKKVLGSMSALLAIALVTSVSAAPAAAKGTGGTQPERYYTIELTDVVVTGVSVSGSANELSP